jgi:plastocyanin
MKRILVITLAALAAALAAACGGGGGGGDQRPETPTGPANPVNPGTPVQSASVDMRSSEQGDGYGGTTINHTFSPSQVTVARGGAVTWTNNSGFEHSVSFSTASGAPSDIPPFNAGSISRTFQTAGTFSYRCSLHTGMTGTVVVP